MKQVISGQYTTDGAGVKLFRVFAHDTVKLTDPFLLLDAFGSDDPKDYVKGFPWHPHRGIETVTYMLNGTVEHEDSLGNKGVIHPGEIQWMTAGRGILHQEMPKPAKGVMSGMQLWVNLPRKKKMMHPRYRGILENDVPIIASEGIRIKVIAGSYSGKQGPVTDLAIDVDYLDVSLEKGKEFSYEIKKGCTCFCYLIEGKGEFDNTLLQKRQLILLDSQNLKVNAVAHLRFILASGKPIREPIAWGGPIVMNTEEELRTAFAELDSGKFIRK